MILSNTFNPKIPEIYQLEVTNACNFSCGFCVRDLYKRKPVNLDLELAKKISERDIAGSYFIEFQLSGEPLLHPNLSTIVDYFKGKVITGLSTNGNLIHKQLDAICKLDYLTISMDSIDDYQDLRKGGNSKQLVDNIDLLMSKRPSSLTIDFQVIELNEFSTNVQKNIDDIKELIHEKKWDVNFRTVPDCFLGTRGVMEVDNGELCLNPWLSVSLQSDGDVVPCCFSFGKNVVYGNLNDDSLKNIWNNSLERKELQHQHLTKQYNSLCSHCYMRSPVILHENIFKKTMKDKLKRMGRIYG